MKNNKGDFAKANIFSILGMIGSLYIPLVGIVGIVISCIYVGKAEKYKEDDPEVIVCILLILIAIVITTISYLHYSHINGTKY